MIFCKNCLNNSYSFLQNLQVLLMIFTQKDELIFANFLQKLQAFLERTLN